MKGMSLSIQGIVILMMSLLAAGLVGVFMFSGVAEAEEGPITGLIEFGEEKQEETQNCLESDDQDCSINGNGEGDGSDDGATSGNILQVEASDSDIEAGDPSPIDLEASVPEGYEASGWSWTIVEKTEGDNKGGIENPGNKEATYNPPGYVSESKTVEVELTAEVAETSSSSEDGSGAEEGSEDSKDSENEQQSEEITTTVEIRVEPPTVQLSEIESAWSREDVFPNSLITEGEWGEMQSLADGEEIRYEKEVRQCDMYRFRFKEDVAGNERDTLRAYWGGTQAELDNLNDPIEIPEQVEEPISFDLEAADLTVKSRRGSTVNFVLTCGSGYDSSKTFQGNADWVESCRSRNFGDGVNQQTEMTTSGYLSCVTSIAEYCEDNGIQDGVTGCGKAMGDTDAPNGGSNGICQLFGYSTWNFGKGCVNG
jgi:hypothetical protein